MQLRVHEAQCHHFSRRGFRSTGPVRISMAAALTLVGSLSPTSVSSVLSQRQPVNHHPVRVPLGNGESPRRAALRPPRASSECTLTQALSLAMQPATPWPSPPPPAPPDT